MELWDEPFEEPNESDLTARRVVSLAIVLTNANRPLLTSEIRHEIYGELETGAFRKTFQRDRARLAEAGIVLKNGPKAPSEVTWEIDAASTFVQADALTPEEALTLDFLLLPLASDPSYPYAHDLRMALTKIDRSFDVSAGPSLPPEARSRNKSLGRVEHALVERRVIQVQYVRVDGSKVLRQLAPYGLFELHNSAYLVAAKVKDGVVIDEAPHTYNLDRMSSVRIIARSSYTIPPDFDVQDYKVLPFQIGPVLYEATFEVPVRAFEELRRKHPYCGVWQRSDVGATFVCKVSNEQYAASWAIMEELRPINPYTLINTWRIQLRRTAEFHA